jgi:CRISPR/Cas system-associated exonuclease Cas4 (RecB family)
VDRLDLVGEGGLHVVDYKTGRASGYREATPFAGGRRLQHLLYALAVEHLQPGAQVTASEYHFPTRRGENAVVSYRRDELRAGPEVLTTLLDLVRDGRFLATTSADDCRYCDFAAVCRVRRGEHGSAASPRAHWAKTTGAASGEYAPLVRLRAEHGEGS